LRRLNIVIGRGDAEVHPISPTKRRAYPAGPVAARAAGRSAARAARLFGRGRRTKVSS